MSKSSRLPPARGRCLAALVLAVGLTGCSTGPGPATAPSPAGEPGSPRARQSATGFAPESPDDLPEPTVEPSGPFPAATVTVRTAAGDAVDVAVHVAADPDTRRRGLMHREDVPPGTGMLFVFPDDRTGGFWMKDTLVALSIAFADADGRIVRILDMEPCEQDPCRQYRPGVPYRLALEVPQGDFDRSGVREGDMIAVPDDLATAR